MDTAFVILVAVVILGLAFDYVNGFHDTANALATVVATRVLSPMWAVLMAATLNFVGALSGTAVASTVGKGIIEPGAVTQQLVMAALLSAIAWNLLTWYYGIPSSSSHALVFSLVGAGVAAASTDVLVGPATGGTCHSGSSWPRRRRWASGQPPAAGASSRRWGTASSS